MLSRKSEDTPVSWPELLNRQHAAALALVAMGVWLHAADALLVATMLPALVADIGGEWLVAWTVALYEVGSVLAGISSGLLAVRYGIRGPMAASSFVFAAGCVISAAAPSMPVVLFGRLLQGLGGGGLVALSFVATGILFPRRLVARVMAVVSTFWGVSAFLGPLVGAWFVTHATWRFGFGFFAVQAIGLGVWVISRPGSLRARNRLVADRGVPWAGLSLVTAGVLAVAAAGIVDDLPSTLACLALGFGCLAGFLVLDRVRGIDRLLPLAAFDVRSRVGSALIMVLAFSVATIALGTYGPLLLTRVHGASVLVAGYVLALESVGWSLAAVAVSGAPERYDARLIAVGMAMVAASTAGLAFAVPGGPVWLVGVFAVVAGAGFGTAWTFVLRRATSRTPAGERERVAAAFPTAQRFGYALGAAVIGIVANDAGMAVADSASEARVVAGWVFAACLPFTLAGLAAMARFVTAPPDGD